jgi:type VI secretion system secreted protein VgrG
MAIFDANTSRIDITVAGISDPLAVYKLQGMEGLSQCFEFKITLVTDRPNLDLDAMLQKSVRLTLKDTHGDRVINGIVLDVMLVSASERWCYYALTVRPRHYLLDYRRNFRIFQEKTVQAIITQVLQDANIFTDEFMFALELSYKPREYCVQYGETDLQFIARIMSEEGIHYHFRDGERCVMVMGDTQARFPMLSSLEYKANSGMADSNEVINSFFYRHRVGIGVTQQRDYNFETANRAPASTKQGAKGGEVPLKDYHYPGRFDSDGDAAKATQLKLEQHRATSIQANGTTNCMHLSVGHYQPMAEHPVNNYNQPWLLTQVIHEATQPQVLEELADGQFSYLASFTATPWDIPWRPELISRPLARIDTAIITGPEGEEIYCDKYGRVKVQFHWDLEGTNDEKTSCWLRSSQGWSGGQYGFMAIPRVGQEVIVSYLHGDPDRPIITGRVYNSQQMPAYELPGHKTKTVLRSQTHKGKGYNELSFEDAAGKEVLHMQAQKDMTTQVKNCRSTTVGANHNESIGRDQSVTVNNNQLVTVKQNQTTLIEGMQTISVTKDRNSEITGNEVVVVEKDILVHSNSGGIEISNGVGYVKIDAGGNIVIHGTTVVVNGSRIDLN